MARLGFRTGEMRTLVSVLFFLAIFSCAAAYDPLDPNGNITVKWDIMSWTPDGYVAAVTVNNFQMYRHIMSPGWTLGWTWARREVIWAAVGAEATEQGDCSRFKGNVPHCCKKTPTFVDLLPGVPYNQQFTNCCKGGVLSAWGQDPSTAVSSFQLSVGSAGTTNRTVRLPRNFTLLGPGTGSDSKMLSVVEDDAKRKGNGLPLLQCTRHMCPVRVHWHVMLNYKEYWRVKVSITNFNYQMNYTHWTLVMQHPNFNNVTQVFSFDYKPLIAYSSINDTGMFYGMKFFNDRLVQAGEFGFVQSEMLLQKDKNTFTLREGWAFPRKVYFNGDECQFPPPDVYPFLPNSAQKILLSFSALISSFFFLFIAI
ncbi:hypothetical protein DVH24_028457 [Malus domestica]|uniref:COBRA C-terminal domain-containing protein n=1 Tax=Malus domestica TaxID=3750 RepID=A0A498HC09_MALDO|nr:hypothetical protein DVH24_028457 [Malus domestica]